MGKYTQYTDFYNQEVTLPIKGFRGTKVNMSMVITAVVMFLITAVFTSLIFPGERTVFGIQKLWVIIGVSAFFTYFSSRIDTANYPFFIYLYSISTFFIKKFKKKAVVSFEEVDRPAKKINYNWKVRYRDIVDNGEDIEYRMVPIAGLVKHLKGLAVTVTGATRIKYNPFTKKVRFETGKIERLLPQRKSISTLKRLNMEIGRGKVQFLIRKQKIEAVYTPENVRGKGEVSIGE